MDLITIILSVFVRLSPAVSELSRISGSQASRHSSDRAILVFWLPLFGSFSVSVQHKPAAFWLPWRVRGVYSFDHTLKNRHQKQGWRVDVKKWGRLVVLQLRSLK